MLLGVGGGCGGVVGDGVVGADCLLAGFGGWDALPDSLVGLRLAGWLPLLVLVA